MLFLVVFFPINIRGRLMYIQMWATSNEDLLGISFGAPWPSPNQTSSSFYEMSQSQHSHPLSQQLNIGHLGGGGNSLQLYNYVCNKSHLSHISHTKRKSPMNPAWSVCFSFHPVYFEKCDFHEEHKKPPSVQPSINIQQAPWTGNASMLLRIMLSTAAKFLSPCAHT